MSDGGQLLTTLATALAVPAGDDDAFDNVVVSLAPRGPTLLVLDGIDRVVGAPSSDRAAPSASVASPASPRGRPSRHDDAESRRVPGRTSRHLDDTDLLVRAHYFLASTAENRRPDDARRHYIAAIAAAESAGLPDLVPSASIGLAIVEFEGGARDQGLARYETAVAAIQRRGDEDAVVVLLPQYAGMLISLGRFDDAHRALRRVERAVGDDVRITTMVAAAARARLERHRGRADVARRQARRADAMIAGAGVGRLDGLAAPTLALRRPERRRLPLPAAVRGHLRVDAHRRRRRCDLLGHVRARRLGDARGAPVDDARRAADLHGHGRRPRHVGQRRSRRARLCQRSAARRCGPARPGRRDRIGRVFRGHQRNVRDWVVPRPHPEPAR